MDKGIVSIQLSSGSDCPKYIQLKEALARLITQGELIAGEQLPPVRRLATELGVTPLTVASAYKELARAGLAVARVGSGTFVSARSAGADEEPSAEWGRSQIDVSADMVNFMTAAPSPDQFPVADFKTAVVEALDRDGAAVFSYDDSRGYLPLREAYAAGLRDRGVPCSADSVQVVSGAQQGLDIVAKALLAPGDEVIVERPTYPGALAAFRSRGAIIRELPLTPGGPDLTELRRLMRSGQPRLLYLMPDFQNPTGYCYTAHERETIVRAAAKAGVFILEEDTFSDLDYGGRQLRPLAAITGNRGTIHLRSFSKVLMPGLRLAFLVVPPELQPAVLAAKQATDITSSGLNQRALDLMMRRGSWERCLARMVESYRSRYQLMRSRLQTELPDAVHWYSYDGGLYFWLELPPQCAATEVAAELRAAGVLVSPGREFFARRSDRQYIRLSCAAADADAIERGCRALGQALHRRVSAKPATRPYPWL